MPFHLIDWLILAVYLVIVVLLGMRFGRRASRRREFFLAGRSMPVWAVAISILATSQSAATFVGGPQQSFDGDLTYLSAQLGALVAVVVVAFVFLPVFYRRDVVSVYELLGQVFGLGAQRSASAMFMIGRVMASGARLYIVAIPFAMVAFGRTTPPYLLAAIGAITVTAAAYTLVGGIRAVIWTDVLQAVVYVGCVAVALGLLLSRIPLGPVELADALRSSDDAGKLTLIDTSLDLTTPYGLWVVLAGLSLFNMAALGTDQDLTQRMLTCRSASRASWSLIVSYLIGWPVLAMFMLVGLGLFVFYQRPDLMGDAWPGEVVPDDSRKVFVSFILHQMPVGVRGLMMAGLFAAAMSSLDSALNALASTTVSDFYRPSRYRRGRGDLTPGQQVRLSRLAVIWWAVALGAFACVCVFWQQASKVPLIDFALDVMVFAYAGLLGVFLSAIVTRRGNGVTAVVALAVGFAAVAAMTFGPTLFDRMPRLAFGWKMCFATGLSFAVCVSGRRQQVSSWQVPGAARRPI